MKRWYAWAVLLLAAGLGGCGEGEPDPAASGCPAASGPGVEHVGNVEADETWTAADSPHIVTFHFSVHASTLTVEPCAVVRVRSGFNIRVGETSGNPAALVAHGAGPDRPVRFERDDAAEPWGSVHVFPTGSIDFENVTLTGGGDPLTAQNNGGIIVASGNGGNIDVVESVRVVDVNVEDSAGFGVNLNARAAFTEDSSGLVIRGSGALPPGSNLDTSFPLYVDAPALSSIPAGTYTGNALDEILVGGAGSLLDESITFHERGVPYRLLTGFGMAPAATAAEDGLSTLTLEAGVTLRFHNGGPANVWTLDLGGSNGGLPENIWPVRLIADGTEEAPIVLTSAENPPMAGDWRGIEWHGGPRTGNVMRFVHIEYAGGDGGTVGFGCGPGDNDAALIFRNWRPDEPFIESSTFSDSAAGGIVSGWRSDDTGPDFTANTFTNIGNGCEISRWADANGACPDPSPTCFDGD